MKKSLGMKVMLGLMLSLMTSVSFATPVFEDDFESGAGKWNNDKGWYEITTDNPHGGSHCLHQIGSDSHSTYKPASVMQSITPSLSIESAQIDFWFRDVQLQSGGGDDGNVRVTLVNDTGDYIGKMQQCGDYTDGSAALNLNTSSDWIGSGLYLDSLNAGEWYRMTLNYQSGATSSLSMAVYNGIGTLLGSTNHSVSSDLGNLGGVWFIAGGQTDNLGQWYVDDVTVVPEPTAICLLGLGSLMLRRKCCVK